MNIYRWLAVFLATILCTSCGSQRPQGLLLYQTSAAGNAATALVVADADGKELRRIPFVGAKQAAATATANRALVAAEDDSVYVVDAAAGTARKLDAGVTADAWLPTYRAILGGGKRWTVLQTPALDRTYLVDLQEARATELVGLLASHEARLVLTAQFSPDESALLLLTDKGLFLLPTANLQAARRLGNDSNVFSGGFSSDGRQVAYVQKAAGGDAVIIEQVDGSGRTSVADEPEAPTLFAAFVPGQSQLVVLRPTVLSLYNVDGRNERDLLTFGGNDGPRLQWIAPSGKRVLVSVEREKAQHWQLVDIERGAAQPLDALTGYQAMITSRSHRWLAFTDSFAPSSADAPRHFVSLDLETGALSPVLEVDHAQLASLVEVAPDGAASLWLLFVRGDERVATQLWLLPASDSPARKLAEGDGASGSFSPDGREVAVGTLLRQSTGITGTLERVAVAGDARTQLGSGFRAVWLRP